MDERSILSEQKHTRRSHIVPRTYLRGFADDNERLVALRKGKQETFLISIADATVIKDFYELPNHPVSPAAFEETLGRFEKEFSRWRCLLETEELIRGADRVNFSGYLAFQALRGQAFYHAAAKTESDIVLTLIASYSPKEMQTWLGKQGNMCSLEESQLIQERLLAGKMELELGSRAFVQHIDQEIQAIRGHLAKQKWEYVLFKEAYLITSDEPISLLSAQEPRSTDIYHAFMTADQEILMPLTRAIGLRIHPMSDEDLMDVAIGTHDIFRMGSAEEAQSFNHAVRCQAQSVIFAHPSDAALLHFGFDGASDFDCSN